MKSDPLSEPWSDLWAIYDAVQERLREARARTAVAQAEERAIEAEAVAAREAIERSVADAVSETGRPAEVTSKATSPSTSMPPPPPATRSRSRDVDAARSASRPVPDGVRPTVWEVILAIPRDGELRGSDLREMLGLSEGAVNTRLANAKHAKVIETAGWGMYRLTDYGRKLQGQHLRVVSDE